MPDLAIGTRRHQQSLHKKKNAVIFIGKKPTSLFFNHIIPLLKNNNKIKVIVLVREQELPIFNEYKNNNKEHVFHKIDEVIPYEVPEIGVLSKIINQIAQTYNVCGIVEYEKDMCMEAAILAKELNLPCTGIHAAKVSSNQLLQREILKNTNWTVWHTEVKNGPLNFSTLPKKWIIKKVDRDKPNKIWLWNSELEKQKSKNILHKFMTDKNSKFVIEEYLSGPSYMLIAFVKNGRVMFHSLAQKDTYFSKSKQQMIDKSYFAPTFYMENFSWKTLMQLKNMAQLIINQTKIGSTPIYLNFKIGPNNIPKIISWRCCAPNNYILNLYRFSDFDPYEAILQVRLKKGIVKKKKWKSSANFTSHNAHFFFKHTKTNKFSLSKINKLGLDLAKSYEYPYYIEKSHPLILDKKSKIQIKSMGDLTPLKNEINDWNYFVQVTAPAETKLDDARIKVQRYAKKAFIKEN